MKTIEVSGETRAKRRLSPLKRLLLGASLATACFAASQAAYAGGTIDFGDDKSITVGAGLRTSFTSEDDGAPNGSSRSNDFSLDSIRLYVSGQVTSYLKATFNTERDGDGHIDVLDGYIQFEPSDAFNIWVGRMLPPSDRANLDGPYYLNTWAYPGVASQYPAKFAGRDDGATIWGKLVDKKLVYSFGVFNGHNRIFGASNQSDNVLFAGRVAYNFLDPEPDPAYYTSSTYYGSVNVLTLAVAGMHQTDGVGTATVRGDYNAWNVDGLFEENLGLGVVTLEGAYYQYHTGDVFDVGPGFNGASDTANVGGINEGSSYLLDAAFLFPQKIGWGKFQPVVRYQEFDSDLTSLVAHQYDVGLNYIIDGHNARLSLDWIKSAESGSDTDEIVFGIQAQI